MLKSLLFPQRKTFLNFLIKIWIVLFIITAAPVVCHASVIEDFEEPFSPTTIRGQLPPYWAALGSNNIQFSQGNAFFFGNHNLHAVMTYDSSYYAMLHNTLDTGQPGKTMVFEIRVKAVTSSEAEFSLGIGIGNNTTRIATRYFYSHSSEEWNIIDVEVTIPESGEIDLFLYFHHNTSYGSTSFDVDYLTSYVCDLITYYRDADGDGYGDPNDSAQGCTLPEGFVTDNTDICPNVYNPGQTDTDGDGAGDACDVDADGDGYEGDIGSGDDCNDIDANIYPGAPEACNGKDNNCDGAVDLQCQLGDVEEDGDVDLVDAILALQVLGGANPSGISTDYASAGTDVNRDSRIGIVEVIYILQKVAGLR